MKLSLAYLALASTCVYAGKPQLSVSFVDILRSSESVATTRMKTTVVNFLSPYPVDQKASSAQDTHMCVAIIDIICRFLSVMETMTVSMD